MLNHLKIEMDRLKISECASECFIANDAHTTIAANALSASASFQPNAHRSLKFYFAICLCRDPWLEKCALIVAGADRPGPVPAGSIVSILPMPVSASLVV